MKIKKVFSKLTAASMLVSLLTPLAVLVPRASAAAITWSGGGTGVVDTTAKTVTYNLTDTDNWVGGIAPSDGDSWVFPANMAPVDPGNANTDDWEWKYVVNNDLADGTEVAGITFSGDTGSDCQVYDDRYIVIGNDIDLTGDVLNTTTGECNYNVSHLLLAVTLTGDSRFEARNDATGSFSSGQIIYGDNELTICGDSSDSNLTIDGLNGDGEVIVNCRNLYIHSSGGWSSGRNITVAEGGTLALQNTQPVNLVTLGDEASVSISTTAGSPYPEQVIATDFVFLGSAKPYTPGGVGGGDDPLYTFTNKSPAKTVNPRLSIYYQSWENAHSVYKPRNVKFTGDITFNDDIEITHHANVNLAGKITGNGKAISSSRGSSGNLKITSTDNTSSTAVGEKKPEYNIQEIEGIYGNSPTDLYDMPVQGGSFYYLKTKETVAGNVTIAPYAKFGGIGKVANLTVLDQGVLAPGLSPGCIDSGNLVLNGTYEVELAGTTVCTEYDQTNVTGTVDITGATLELSLLDGFSPPLNSEYVIINNDGSDAVTGTFTGLANGANITLGAITFQINYDGGDGNDVVLTVTASPTAATVPDTGIGTLLTSPILSLSALILAGVTLAGFRRLSVSKK